MTWEENSIIFINMKHGKKLAFGLSLTIALVSARILAASQPAPRIYGVLSDDRSIEFILETPQPALRILPAEQYNRILADFLHLEIPGCGYTGWIGAPKLPMFSAVMEAPSTGKIEIQAEPLSYSDIIIDRRVAPAMAPVPKLPGARPELTLDEAAYASDSFFPENLAEIYDASVLGGLARGHRLAAARVYPVAYQPKSNRLRLYTRIRVRIAFQNSLASAQKIPGPGSRAWEELLDRICVFPRTMKSSPGDSIYYDIFYGSSFENAARKLAEWKARLGYKVRVRDAGGWSAKELRDTIINRQPLATYVLLISDPNAGNFDSIPGSAPAQTTGLPTDLYYAVVDSGYLPDLFLGRLSVRTPPQADTAVEKIIRYQCGDFGSAGSGWITRALFIAGFDYSYQPICQATNRYCYQLLKRSGYQTVDTLVMAEGEEEGRIVDRINQGRAWTVYSAHGNPIAWNIGYSSNFTVDEVKALLHNQDMPTMVSGHCCNSAYIFWSSGDCFGEAWGEHPQGGGLGYFGSFPFTYWDEDDILQRRYFDAIYDSVPGTPGLHLYNIGRFTQYGLYWLELNSTTNRKQYYFEAYHLLGDPEAEIWTAPPQDLVVRHADLLPPNADQLAVTVLNSFNQPLADVRICLWSRKDPSRHIVSYTDATGCFLGYLGPAILNDTIMVTASKHNYRPYLGQALVKTRLTVTLSTRRITVNVPTQINLTVTDPDSSDAPVCSLDLYASENGAAAYWLARTDSLGQAAFILNAARGGFVALSGWRQGDELLRDTIRVLAPEHPLISSVYPNPARQLVHYNYELPQPGRAQVAVFNVFGQRVADVLNAQMPAGYHTASWNGRDHQGRCLPAGVYFLALRFGQGQWSPAKRIVWLK